MTDSERNNKKEFTIATIDYNKNEKISSQDIKNIDKNLEIQSTLVEADHDEEVDGSGAKFTMTNSERNNKEEKISSQDIKNIDKDLEMQSTLVEADHDEEVDGSGAKFTMTDNERNNKKEFTITTIDHNKNGKISSQDIKNIDKDLEIQSTLVEADHDEEIDESGAKFMMTDSERNKKKKLTIAFNIIDHDKNGKISSEDIKNIAKELEIQFTDAEIQSMVVEAGCDDDGEVNIEAFMRMMKTPSQGY